MNKTEKWLMPAYCREFKCKADRCRNTCCSNWRIPVSKEEYQRLITMNCSKELDRRIQNAFIIPETVTDSCYRYVSFNWLGECPIQDKGLCYLHREKGEEYLPKICRLYPRSCKQINGTLIMNCSSSCERVVEMLYESDSLDIIEEDSDMTPELYYEIDKDDIKQLHLFQRIIQDRSTTLAQSIIDICRIINEEEFEKDYASDADPLKEVLKLMDRFLSNDDHLSQIAETVIDRYRNNPGLYASDRERFEKDFPDWMTFFERVINNSMIYENFPFVDERSDRTDAYKGLCVCYGLMRIVCIGYTAVNHGEEDLIDAVAALFHLIDHTAFYYNVGIIVNNAAILLKL
ncbi:MAG: flagellin lysine-N-methylase [Erysipelotrichaceae bacterium]|nr:flagellin lysine-N-methylase [Erysipelotrichaceae bacterium]